MTTPNPEPLSDEGPQRQSDAERLGVTADLRDVLFRLIPELAARRRAERADVAAAVPDPAAP